MVKEVSVLKRIRLFDALPWLAAFLALVSVLMITSIRWTYLIPSSSSLGTVHYLITPVILALVFLYELILRRINNAVLTFALGIILFIPTHSILMITDTNIHRSTWHICGSVQLPDDGIKITFGWRKSSGGNWSWFPERAPGWTWKAVIERKGSQACAVDLNRSHDSSLDVILYIIETQHNRILRIYSDELNQFIDLNNLSNTKWQNGTEHQVAVFSLESNGRFAFKPLKGKPQPAVKPED